MNRNKGIRVGALIVFGALLIASFGWSQPNSSSVSLNTAVLEGNVEKVQTLLQQNPQLVNQQDFGPSPPLVQAAEFGKPQMVALLVTNNADINAHGVWGKTALHFAANRGDAALVEFLLKHKADVNARDEDGLTPIVQSIHSTEVIKLLLAYGADINAHGGRNTLYSQAVGNPQSVGPGVIDLILTNGADVTVSGEEGWYQAILFFEDTNLVRRLVPYYANSTNPAAKPLLEGALETALDHNRRHMALAIISGCVALQANRLHKAVAQDDSVTILSILATNSIAANTKDLFGWTPLHLAAFSGNTGVAEVLLSHQANEDSQDDIHNTPLHYAAYLGHEDFVALMLRHKANMDVQGTFSGFESGGDRPLDFAIEQGFTSIAAMLITNGANLGAHKWWGDTPLHIATAKENVPVMKLLLSHGARVNVVRGDYKQSPLDIAVCGNSPEAVRLLLNSGANLQTSMRAESRTNTSLVHLWAHTGNTNIAEQLLAAGLDVNARDGNGQTPLHIAIGKWPADFKEEATLWLLSHNANVNAKDKSGRTPLHLAASCGSTKAVRLLLDHKAEANSSDNNGKTPLALLEDTKIAQSRHSIGGMVNLKEAEKLLVEHGAEGPILEPETNRWSRFR